MLRCKQITQLISESLDGQLTWPQRIQLWMHLLMCGLCSGFRKDVLHLHREARRQAQEIEHDLTGQDVKLSEESRQRIKRELESQRS